MNEQQLGRLERAVNRGIDEIVRSAQARIYTDAERRFLAGEDHFRAKSLLAQLGLAASTKEGEVTRAAYANVMDMLVAHRAEGIIYATGHDVGNGFNEASSADHLLVTARGGNPTGAAARSLFAGTGDHYITLASTENRKFVEQ